MTVFCLSAIILIRDSQEETEESVHYTFQAVPSAARDLRPEPYTVSRQGWHQPSLLRWHRSVEKRALVTGRLVCAKNSTYMLHMDIPGQIAALNACFF